MAIKTKRGAWRRRDAIIRQCYRDLAGGTQYGIDMPTLRIATRLTPAPNHRKGNCHETSRLN